jgi:hypothetical protein
LRVDQAGDALARLVLGRRQAVAHDGSGPRIPQPAHADRARDQRARLDVDAGAPQQLGEARGIRPQWVRPQRDPRRFVPHGEGGAGVVGPELVDQALDDPVRVRQAHAQRLDVVAVRPRPVRSQAGHGAQDGVDEAPGTRRRDGHRLTDSRVGRDPVGQLVGPEPQRRARLGIERGDGTIERQADQMVERTLSAQRSIRQLGDEGAVAGREARLS